MTLEQLPIGKQAVILTVGGRGALRSRLLDMGPVSYTHLDVYKRQVLVLSMNMVRSKLMILRQNSLHWH